VKKYTDHVRTHGIEQLINIYNANKSKTNDALLWGDEVEYMVVALDHEKEQANLSLRQAQILAELEETEKTGKLKEENVVYHPEYGRYMLEATPARPFTGDFVDLLRVQDNMRVRREIANRHMHSNEIPLTITSFPILGIPGQFTEPYYPPTGPASRSLFLPDELINPHARFPTLTANIRTRRGSKVAVNVPIFKDKNTPSPFIDDTIPWDRNLYPEDSNAREGAAKLDHIYMDSMGFGMGCCCLQITFQATDIDEARNLYDQLASLTPILLALTSASPAYRGYLADQDARWNVIAGSVDDRRPVERGLEPPRDDGCEVVNYNSDPVIPKSRYDSIDCYISEKNLVTQEERDHFNDSKLVINKKVKSRLLEAGFDELLANHFAHLFIRDPIVVFEELLDQDDTKDSDHFENIQSTNWQTLRFKPPPTNSCNTGWRVEFRPMEVQITDFENAAFAIFIVLLTRVILSFNLNLYLPISKVDSNMKKAHHKNAVMDEKFWFRTNVFQDNSGPGVYKELTVNQIINGDDNFVGLIPLLRKYFESISIDLVTFCELNRYLDLVASRASGAKETTASWIRNFVRNHPDYKFDSKISPKINYDLIQQIIRITEGKDWDTAGKTILGGYSP
jgi:glutamate--cysteine ligase catalytic subunit